MSLSNSLFCTATAWKRHNHRGGGGGGGDDNNPFGNPSTPGRGNRNHSPRRSLWGRNTWGQNNSPRSRNGGGDWSPRSSGRNSPAGSVRGGSHRDSPSERQGSPSQWAGGRSGGGGSSRGGGGRGRGWSGGWNPLKGAPLPRWLASWRRDYEGYEIVTKVGDAVAVANGDHGLSGTCGGGMSINGGVINTVGASCLLSRHTQTQLAPPVSHLLLLFFSSSSSPLLLLFFFLTVCP
jgi:hypothetical protein